MTRERNSEDSGRPADGSLRGPAPRDRPNPDGTRTADGVRLEDAATADTTPDRRVLSAIVDHDPGVLTAVAGLFSRRMFNIESLTVGPTADDDYARVTIVVEESESGVEQARKQLASLPTVHLVSELDTDAVERELALLKVNCEDPEEVEAVARLHDAEVVDVCPESATVQVTGSERDVDGAIEAFGRFSLREVTRTGTTALDRSATTVYDDADHGRVPPDFEPEETAAETHSAEERTAAETHSAEESPTAETHSAETETEPTKLD